MLEREAPKNRLVHKGAGEGNLECIAHRHWNAVKRGREALGALQVRLKRSLEKQLWCWVYISIIF